MEGVEVYYFGFVDISTNIHNKNAGELMNQAVLQKVWSSVIAETNPLPVEKAVDQLMGLIGCQRQYAKTLLRKAAADLLESRFPSVVHCRWCSTPTAKETAEQIVNRIRQAGSVEDLLSNERVWTNYRISEEDEPKLRRDKQAMKEWNRWAESAERTAVILSQMK